MAIRIYVVTNNDTKEQRLIRANNRADVVRYLSRTTFSIEAASQDDLVNLLLNGVKIKTSKVDMDTKLPNGVKIETSKVDMDTKPPFIENEAAEAK